MFIMGLEVRQRPELLAAGLCCHTLHAHVPRYQKALVLQIGIVQAFAPVAKALIQAASTAAAMLLTAVMTSCSGSGMRHHR